jgi:hypothetical protein
MRCARILLPSVGVLVLVAASVTPSHAGMEYDVNFVLGNKSLDENDWEPFEDQPELAVCSAFGKADWPVRIALDLMGSRDDRHLLGTTISGSTTEFDVGVRKIWNRNRTRPFLGGGLAFVTGRIEIGGSDIEDDGGGAWIDGGAFWRLGKRFNIGVEARVSRAEISIGPVDVEAGGDHIGLILGFGSPSD